MQPEWHLYCRISAYIWAEWRNSDPSCNLINLPAQTWQPVVFKASRFVFIAKTQFQTTIPAHQILPAQVVYEVNTDAAVWALVTRFRKNLVLFHKHIWYAMGTGPAKCIVEHEWTNELQTNGGAADVFCFLYKKARVWQTEREGQIRMRNKTAE